MTNYFVINTEAAIHKEGKWLVGIRSGNESEAAGLLSFVGGTVEQNDPFIDTLENAVKREVMEEISVKIKVTDFVNNSSFISKKGNHVINIVFLCEIVEGEPIIASTDEMESLIWLTTAEIIDYPNVPKWMCESVKIADTLAQKFFNN